MIQLIVYLVVIGGLAAGAFGIIHSHDNGVRAKEAEQWKPKLQAAQLDTKTAIDANASLSIENARVRSEAKACSDGVDLLTIGATKNEAKKAAALLAAKGMIATLEADIAAKDAVINAGTPAGENCGQTLTRIDGPLRDLAARRLRDHAPADGSVGGVSVPAAPKNPGPGSLRLTQ